MANLIFKSAMLITLSLILTELSAGQVSLPKQCSLTNANAAVINEIKASGGGVGNEAFVEIKTLVDNIDISDWQICVDSPANCIALGLGNGGWNDGISTRLDNNSPFGNSTFPANYWLTYGFSVNPSEGEVILLDSAGDVIDYVKYGSTVRDCTRDLDFDVPSECGLCVTGRDSNQKDFARIPDGTGSWGNNGNTPSANDSNDGSNAPLPNRVAEWFFDELAWTGLSDEILDQSPNNLHLTMFNNALNENVLPAIAGDPGSCRYGNFLGNSYLQINDTPALDRQTFSISVWIYPRRYPLSGLMSIVSKDTNYEFHLDSNGDIYWWWGGGSRELRTSGANIPVQTWTHITISYRAGEQVIYINGNPVATNNWSEPLATNNRPFQIGQDQGISSRYFDGYIDEVKIFERNLIAREVRQVMMDSRPCPVTSAISGFLIEHDTNALTCQAEAIRISAINALGEIIASFGGQVNLSTSTNHGTWTTMNGIAPNPDPAEGALDDSGNNDGSATYRFSPSDEGSVILYLQNELGEAVDIDVAVGSLTDDDSEGLLTFRPIGFTIATDVEAIAGKPFDATISAIGEDPNNAFCRVIEEYQGNQILDAWTTRTIPTSAPKNISLDGTITGSNVATARSVSVSFNRGVASVVLRYDDVGTVALEVKDDIAVGEPTAGMQTEVVGGTLPIRVSPFGYDVQVDGSPFATSAIDPVFATAGDNFSMRIRSLLWQGSDDIDNDGTPDAGSDLSDNGTTPNIVSIPGGIQLTAIPIGVSNVGSLGRANVNFSAFAAVGGANEGTIDIAQSWSEVGILQIDAFTSNFLGGTRSVSGTRSNIGRFIPTGFELIITNDYQAACGAFSYAGFDDGTLLKPAQTDDILLTINALNRANNITQNYQGAFAKLEAGTFLALPFNTITMSPASGRTTIASVDNLTFTSGVAANVTLRELGYSFNSLANPKVIHLQLDAVDSDSVSGSITTNSVEQRLGRANLMTSYGPEIEPLEVPLYTEFYQDNRWQKNNADNCTTYLFDQLNFIAGSYQGDLDPGETTVMLPATRETIINGQSSAAVGFLLSAPGFGNSGEVDLSWDVTTQPWLRFDWDGDGVSDDPQSTAGFGRHRGSDRIIYWQER